MFLSLLLATAQPNLLTCQEYDWLVEGVQEAKFLGPGEKLDLISVFLKGTDPVCFRIGTEDAND